MMRLIKILLFSTISLTCCNSYALDAEQLFKEIEVPKGWTKHYSADSSNIKFKVASFTFKNEKHYLEITYEIYFADREYFAEFVKERLYNLSFTLNCETSDTTKITPLIHDHYYVNGFWFLVEKCPLDIENDNYNKLVATIKLLEEKHRY